MEATDISFNLTPDHIKEVCRPGTGEKTCRYLMIGTNGMTCGKFGSLMNVIEERISKNEMVSRGDNCDGLLDQIMKAKESLVGKKAHYQESMPYFETEGTVTDLIFDKNGRWLTIGIKAGEEQFPFQVNTGSLEIKNTEKYFQFEICGLAHYAGSAKIFK